MHWPVRTADVAALRATRMRFGGESFFRPLSMIMKWFLNILSLLPIVTVMASAGEMKMNEIRTYMAFTFPVDPAKIATIPDMDVSYALASTLVQWDSDKEISAGLAQTWMMVDPNTIRFNLRKGSVWSDGSPISAAQVKQSFERSLKAYPDDLRSFARLVEAIEVRSDHEIDFKLKVAARDSGLLGKLTEPNYGVLRVDTHGKLDLHVTTGAFFIEPGSDQSELRLIRNRHWAGYRDNKNTPERVTIRKAPPEMDSQTVLLADSWPNLIETSSLIGEDTEVKFKTKNFSLWRRPLDKFFYFQIGKRLAHEDGLALSRFIRSKIRPEELVSGLSGYSVSKQIFPAGYQLHDPNFYCSDADATLPERFRGKSLEILVSTARISPTMKENIGKAIFKATGVEPRFISIPLEYVRKAKAKGDYDFYVGTMGLADPDPEGIMSFYLEGDAPLIHPQGNDFLKRLDAARGEKSAAAKFAAMRSILTEAVRRGYVLPIFQLSTIGVGRPELDFSHVPTSDESTTFSKIRFKNVIGGDQ